MEQEGRKCSLRKKKEPQARPRRRKKKGRRKGRGKKSVQVFPEKKGSKFVKRGVSACLEKRDRGGPMGEKKEKGAPLSIAAEGEGPALITIVQIEKAWSASQGGGGGDTERKKKNPLS